MIRGSLRGPKRTIPSTVQRTINEMTERIIAEGDRFKKTHEFISKDGQHAWRAGKNATTGTWDHRHYSKQGNGWKHHPDHGYDGHESKEDAAASAKGDRDSHDSGKRIDEASVQGFANGDVERHGEHVSIHKDGPSYQVRRHPAHPSGHATAGSPTLTGARYIAKRLAKGDKAKDVEAAHSAKFKGAGFVDGKDA